MSQKLTADFVAQFHIDSIIDDILKKDISKEEKKKN